MSDDTDVPSAAAAPEPDWPKQPTAVLGEYSAWLPCHRKSSRLARTMLRDFLEKFGDGEVFAVDGELVLAELVGNAAVHGRSAVDQLIFVRFERRPGVLHVEVHDPSSELPVLRPATGEDECGRGLQLVDRLALAWGSGPRVGVGKLVWATVGPLQGLTEVA